MNRLFGTVLELESEGEFSLVGIDVAGTRLTSLVLESATSAAYLAPGNPITVLFKESEVSLAVGPLPRISIRNRLPCRVVSLAEGGILAHVVLAFAETRLHALISTRAARELELSPGAAVYALIKATEVGLAEGHVQP
ncbi:MAG: TOBE domain-containing protein [Fibrobacteres bacterium]|nr:TOBE domain-containing protein [Fibrobacterota bacterium]